MLSRPEGLRLTVKQALGLAALSCALAVALAEAYRAFGTLLASVLLGSGAGVSVVTWMLSTFSGGLPWLAAALIHTVLAIPLAVLYLKGRAEEPAAAAPFPWIRGAFWRSYAPAAAVLAGAGVLVLLSHVIAGASAFPATRATIAPLAWVIWVPPVEELVFRAGIGRFYQRLAPGWVWPAWFSALTFALVHASPTVGHVLSGHIGLPLGPFLLGLACEALLRTTGRLAPAIVLHAACNATATVFVLGDSRWLDWLGFLYS